MNINAFFVKDRKDANTEINLSVSKVKTFDSCKAKYKYSYIEKLPKKEWDFHVFGTFMHDTLENFHKRLIENAGKSSLPAGVNKDAEQESLWREFMQESFKNSLKEFGEKVTKENKDLSFSILKDYLKMMGEQKALGTLPEVTDVERGFYIDIGDGKVLLNGFIDRIQIDPDGVIHVADYKTTKDKKYLKDFFQLETYAYVLFLSDPNLELVRCSFICLRHNFDYLTKVYRRKDVEFIGKRYIDYYKDIGDEVLYRPNPQFLCKYCDFLDNCYSGQKYLKSKGMYNDSDSGVTFGLADRW